MIMKLFTDVKIGRRLAMGFGITIAFMALIVVAGQIYFDGSALLSITWSR